MRQIPESFKKVHYELRSCKQVERRMLVHTFQSLMRLGYPIEDYRYVGMGSMYFIDFILFHKYLGLKKFLSIEVAEEYKKRHEFNRPFRCVEIKTGDIKDYIPQLSQDTKHILWLDYDDILTQDILIGVHLAASHLSPESVLLITVDVEPPGNPEDGLAKWNPKNWRHHFITEASDYLWPKPIVKEFARDLLPNINARLINNAIQKGLLGRNDVAFHPLFNFLYADGHKMLSIGGMIGTETDERMIRSLDKKNLYFLRNSIIDRPYEIRVPLVTRKERLYLDREMPCKDGWIPKEFEMSKKDVLDYRSVYRYYPAFVEMLL